MVLVYPEAEALLYEASDLPPQLISYAGQYARGFGYWQWKPFVVCDVIGRAREGDTVFYLDGRCGGPQGGSIGWLDKFISGDLDGDKPDAVAWKMRYVERAWCTGDLMNKFGIDFDSDDGRSGQFSAGFFALRVNGRTVDLVRRWKEFSLKFPELCRDEQSKIPNHGEFIENRHDQSVFSLLIKTLSKQGLAVFELSDEEIFSSRSVRPHVKQHPGAREIPGCGPA